MLRNIHLFTIKAGPDEARMLCPVDNELAAYARGCRCIERKTWKLLDARAQGQPAESTAYMNEALWPGQKEADAFSQAEVPEAMKAVFAELAAGIEIQKTVRYVDAQGKRDREDYDVWHFRSSI